MFNDADEEFDLARRESQNRFRGAFEAIYEKYGRIDEEDDVVDLSTGRIIVDNGRIRKSEAIALGDLYLNSGPNTPSSFEYSNRSESPELFANGSIIRDRKASKRSFGNGYDIDEDDDEDDLGLFSFDFSAYNSNSERSQQQKKKQLRRRRISSRNTLNYDSSDSMTTTDLETSIDMYFTSSIENYLDKLRQQLSSSNSAEEEEPSERGNDNRIHDGRYLKGQDYDGAISESSIDDSIEAIDSNLRTTDSYETTFPQSYDNGYFSEEEPIYSDTHAVSANYPNNYDLYQSDESSIYDEEEVVPEPIHYDYEEYETQGKKDLGFTSAFKRANMELPIGEAPRVFRPQPVAPHVFFDCGNAQEKMGVYEDDNASIHSGEFPLKSYQLGNSSYSMAK